MISKSYKNLGENKFKVKELSTRTINFKKKSYLIFFKMIRFTTTYFCIRW